MFWRFKRRLDGLERRVAGSQNLSDLLQRELFYHLFQEIKPIELSRDRAKTVCSLLQRAKADGTLPPAFEAMVQLSVEDWLYELHYRPRDPQLRRGNPFDRM